VLMYDITLEPTPRKPHNVIRVENKDCVCMSQSFCDRDRIYIRSMPWLTQPKVVRDHCVIGFVSHGKEAPIIPLTQKATGRPGSTICVSKSKEGNGLK
jgi:hypothetical protein